MYNFTLGFLIPRSTLHGLLLLCFYISLLWQCRSPDGDTDYFDIVAGVLQGATLAPYLFIICLDYELRTSIDEIKKNDFKLTKERSRRYTEKQLPTRTTPMT